MKKTVLIVAAALFLTAASAAAQAYDPAARNSIELTTGFSPIHTRVMYGGGDNKLYPNIGLGYTHAMNEKWDFNAYMGLATASVYESSQVSVPDFRYSLSAGIDFRFKWYHNERLKLYSSLGFGLNPDAIADGIPIPIPYFTPLGINFGRGSVYGIGELTVGPLATFWLVGIGIRL